jgi:hypothetical protein
MPRPHVSVPPEAIRIEDEVWQDAFARIEQPPRRRLHAIEGGRSATLPPRRDVTPVPAEPRTAAAVAMRTPRVRQMPEEGTAMTAATAAPRSAAGLPAAERRTVTIRGYGAERNLPWPETSRRRPQQRPYERAGFRPDRLALWAVFLGVLLLVVAVASGHS